MKTKYIFVSGGVISGLGKGITTASVALLLKSQGYKVAPIKCDMYLNQDAGTMNPLEHGEIFVTDDGTEADLDLGHYERFLNENLTRQNYLTAGQVYQHVLDKERRLAYQGKCVEAYFHIPREIIRRLEKLGQKAQVVIVEFGGTVGEYQNVMFFEAARRMKIKHQENVIFIHVGYLPAPGFIGEMKSKPLQQSIQQLNELGIQPDAIVCRSQKAIDKPRKEKVALAAALPEISIFANPDVDNPYEIPLILKKQGMEKFLNQSLNLKKRKRDLKNWRKRISQSRQKKSLLKIAMVAKYYTSGNFTLKDAYVSVVEALKHAAWANQANLKIKWIDSERIERLKNNQFKATFSKVDGVVVPQGWGSRGVEGKIKAIQYCRENNLPYLGLCFGMQMAVIEFGRHVLDLKKANSEEVDPQAPHPVIHLMPSQKSYLKKRQYGGTIRLGAWPCRVKTKTHLAKAYGRPGIIHERHRHRYEFNNRYRQKYLKAGMVFAGVSPDKKLIEAIELPDHPFFIGTQFHPEYRSRPLSPHPLFRAFIKTAAHLKNKA